MLTAILITIIAAQAWYIAKQKRVITLHKSAMSDMVRVLKETMK